MAGLTLADVRFWYPATERPALDGVSLTMAPGDVVAVIGSVGAGASTLLLVAGNLAPRVTGGRLEGAVRTAPSGIVLPTPWTQASGMAFSVWDEVAFGPANLGVPRDEIARRVDRWLARLEVTRLPAEMLTMTSVLELLRADHGARSVLCEGGPTILGALLAEDLVDELFLSRAPRLVAGYGPSVVEGPELPHPAELDRAWVLESDGVLLLRYLVNR